MRAVVLMFDSLNRHMLAPYLRTAGAAAAANGPTPVAPNFARLAERTAVFDRSYVCSMPCMPARRDFHTGRPNFLHRSWGPLEPYDDSVPAMLRDAGVHTHLATDHYHYFEEGGANYHTKYTTWEFFRGQEGDPWRGMVDPPPPEQIHRGPAHGRNAATDGGARQDQVNRMFMRNENDQPQSRTMAAGIDFLRRNAGSDNWLLHLETFDPHEPFFTQRRYKDLYAEHYARWRQANGPVWDWPAYQEVTEDAALVEHMRHEYAALVSMCDARLGDVLDSFDELQLWDDTLLAVWTDHGFLLGEHDVWAKCWMPFYQEIANTPFFLWDPRHRVRGERRDALVQPAIDLAPTLLELFGQAPTADMLGGSLQGAVADDAVLREAAIFGMHGHHVNVTDGRYVYMRGPTGGNEPLAEYTLMPAHMRHAFAVEALRGGAELAAPFSFTKGCRQLRIERPASMPGGEPRELDVATRLYDVNADPRQLDPLADAAAEQRMVGLLDGWLEAVDAPPEQRQRLGLAGAGTGGAAAQ